MATFNEQVVTLNDLDVVVDASAKVAKVVVYVSVGDAADSTQKVLNALGAVRSAAWQKILQTPRS